MSAVSAKRIYKFEYDPPQISIEEYILPFRDVLVEHFVNDARIKSAEKRSRCKVKLLPKSINRKIHNAGWVKYAVIQISGPNDKAIRSCTRSIENFYPNFVTRKPYVSKAIVAFYVDEEMPDNLNYSESIQRSSHSDICFHDMKINSSYSLENRTDNPCTKPWKISQSDKVGIFNPHLSHIYNTQFHLMPETIQFRKPILKTISGKMENSHLSNDLYSTNSYIKNRLNSSKLSEVLKLDNEERSFNDKVSEGNLNSEDYVKPSNNRKSVELTYSPKSNRRSIDSVQYRNSKTNISDNLFDNKRFVQTKRSSSH